MLSVDQLIQNLTDTTQPSVVRSSAIEGLVTQGGARGVKFLIEVLTDSDSMVRREAAKALRNLEATEAIEPLLKALQAEPKDLTAWAMLEAIGELGSPSVIPTLESLSSADSMLTRIEVKKSIRRIRDQYGIENISSVPREEETTARQAHPTRPSELRPSQDTPISDSGSVETEEIQGDHKSLLPYPINKANSRASIATEETDKPGREQTAVSTEDTFEAPPVETDQITTALPEDGTEQENHTPFSEATEEILSNPEFIEEVGTDTEHPGFDEETEISDTEPLEPDEEIDIPIVKSRDSEEDMEINDLVKSISRSPRLAGSSVALPVLAPNASTVPYQPEVAPSEKENFFLAVLHPGKYLSKRWVSRTRVYLVLWGVLLAATVGFIQYQRHRNVEEIPLSHIGLSHTEVPDLVRRSLAEGDFYIQEGHYRQAISAYQLSRELGALPIHFYRKLGFAYFKEGQYALASEAYEIFLEEREKVSAPDVFTAEASLSGMYSTTNSVEAAIVQDYETYNILGTAYMELGHLRNSQRAYEQAIHLAPKYGEAYNNLARLYVDGYQQKLWLAETLAYTAVTLNPNVAAYHDTLGWILSKRGRVNKAMKTLERSINLQSDAVASHYHLAQVALKADQRQKAIKSIRNVFKLNPAYVHLNTINGQQ